jgi:hypothetical protein
MGQTPGCTLEITMKNKILQWNKWATLNVVMTPHIIFLWFRDPYVSNALRTCIRCVDTARTSQQFPVAWGSRVAARKTGRFEVSVRNLEWKCQRGVMDDQNKPVMWQCWRYYIGNNFSVATSVFMRLWSQSVKKELQGIRGLWKATGRKNLLDRNASWTRTLLRTV